MNLTRTLEPTGRFRTLGRRLRVALPVLCLATALMLGISASDESRGVEIPVPNGDFQTIYKPGSTTITAIPSSWVDGVGPNALVNGANGAQYSDGTSGPDVFIPGWIGHPDWPPALDPGVSIHKQGAIQGALGDNGTIAFVANGTNWGEPQGEMAVSAASLGNIENGSSYTLSVRMALRGGTLPNPLVWDLLADGEPLTPSSSVEPDFTADFQDFSKTYDAASLAGHRGESLTIRLGVDHPSDTGSQMKFDNVRLDVMAAPIPEPSTLLLAAVGILSLAWYGWRRH